MEKAREIVAHGGPYMTPLSAQALSNSIAHALDTQRAEVVEECAKMADNYFKKVDHPPCYEPENCGCVSEIAQAIRSLKDPKQGDNHEKSNQ